MGRRETMTKRLDNIPLPSEKPDMRRHPRDYDSRYIPVLMELGVRSDGDFRLLDRLLAERLTKMSTQITEQAKKDLESGKIKDIKDVPLYKNAAGLHNIPPEFAPWLYFQAWLNAREEEVALVLKDESALKNNEGDIEISADMFKKIKNMSREQMQSLFAAVYADGKSGKQSAPTVNIDLEALRSDIGSVKGVGESRLNEIMSIIEKNIK